MKRNILKLVLSSPRDVAEERDIVELVAAELNKGVAADYNVLFEVVRWETDAFPGFHKAGPQGLIDPILDIENCDILIGIFWQRFGTPTRDAGSGTEHEFMKAYESWKQKDSPQIMMYFKDAEVRLATAADAEQYRKVLEFREKFPEEGLYWRYGDSRQFERLVRNHLTQFLKHQTPNERVFTKHKGDKTDEYRYIRSYCLKLKERFSTINLFGEGDSADENMGRVMKRMRRVETGFVPLHLQDWHDEIDKCERARLEIADIFFAQDADRLVLVRGLPGSGKTTLLRYLVYHYASMGAEGKECIPVYMRCKDISATDTLEEFVLQQINQESESKLCYEALTGPSYFLEKPMVLLFDGLDEIEDRQTSDNVRQGLVLLKKKYPRCHVIITSRPIKLQREDFPQFRHLDLLRLDADMISEYIKKWFGRDTSKITNLQRALVSRPRIKALAGNPFLLSMICFTYQNGGETELIERRSDLYANCTKYLLQRRYDSSTLMDSEEDYVQLLKILKDISLRFFLWQEADFGIDHVNVIGKRYLTAEVLGKTSDFLDDVQQQTGLLQRAKEGFTFVHRSLWEYFTALALIDKKSDDFVIRHAANPDWEEVVRLYAGLLREDEKVKALVNGLWTINRPLALRVTTEVKIPAEELIKPLIERESGNQSRLLLIDSLEQSLPLIQQTERQNLLQETLAILLIQCQEKDCQVIYYAQQLLQRQQMAPLAPGGLIHELLDLEGAAKRQADFLQDPDNCFAWIEVKGGTFWMGDDNGRENEQPAHQAKLDRFYMAKHPVTNKLLSSFPFGNKYPSYGGDSHPAIGNTWWEAYYFALWLNARLATEAEWEYAARGGPRATRTQYFYGDSATELKAHAWFDESEKPYAHAVDELNPLTGKENVNVLGLANMSGNVYEWCSDWYSGNYYAECKEKGIVKNPQGPASGSGRLLRGGGWGNGARYCRSAYRSRDDPGYRDAYVGFRLVFVPQSVGSPS